LIDNSQLSLMEGRNINIKVGVQVDSLLQHIRVNGCIVANTPIHTSFFFPFPFKFLRSLHWQGSPSQHPFTLNGNHPWWDWRLFHLKSCLILLTSNNPVSKYGDFYPFLPSNLTNFLEIFQKNPLLKCQTFFFFFFGFHSTKF